MRFFKTLKAKKSRMIAGLITASMLFSSVPTTLLADDKVDDPEVIGTSSFEVVVEDQESVESTETVVDENVTSIPADETEPTDVVVEPSEEPPITTTEESSEVVPTEDETVPSSEETTLPVEETTEPTEALTEPTEPERWVNMVYVDSQDDFINTIASLPDGNRLIIITDENIDNAFQITFGVAFDGAYVVSIVNQNELDDAVRYLDENSIDYARDGQMTVTGSVLNYYAPKSANGIRVAVIDTGSNNADEIYSVIGEDGSDANGHGTAMCSIVKNSGATVISIQALGANGKGQVTDVYNAIQLANTLDVDYILMSISTRDVGSYGAFKDLVSETVASGTKVVASAGNNNKSASNYIPSNISGVITVGALNDDGTKLDSSNYGDSVNAWVKASSTSEAAAKYIYLILTEETSEIYDSYVTITPTPEVTPEPSDDLPWFVNDDGSIIYIRQDADGNYYGEIVGNSFETTALGVPKLGPGGLAGYENEWNKKVTWPSNVTPGNAGSGTDTGTATMNHVSGGLGYASNIHSNSSSTYKLDSFITNWLYAECTCHRVSSSDDDIYKSQHAFSISDGATVNYTANWTVSKSGNTTTINWTVYFYTSDTLSARRWVRQGSSDSSTYPNSFSHRFSIYVKISSVSGNSSIREAHYYLLYDGTYYDLHISDTFNANLTRYQITDSRKNSLLAAGRTKAKSLVAIEDYNGQKDYVYDGTSDTGDWYLNSTTNSSGYNFVKSFNIYDHYWKTSQSQVYIGAINSDITKVLTGDMIEIAYSTKDGSNRSGKTYTLYGGYGTGSTPTGNYNKTYTATTNASGIATFTGTSYPLGWYYLPTTSNGSYWICLFDYNGECWKSVYHTTGTSFTGATIVQQGAKAEPSATLFRGTDSANTYTPEQGFHSTDKISRPGTPISDYYTFCIQRNGTYSAATNNGWADYSNTNLSQMQSALNNVGLGTNRVDTVTLCKYLEAAQWYGKSSLGVVGSGAPVPNTTQPIEVQKYIWNKQGHGNSYSLPNISFDTKLVNKGAITFPFTFTCADLGSVTTASVWRGASYTFTTTSANFNWNSYRVMAVKRSTGAEWTGNDCPITVTKSGDKSFILTIKNDATAAAISDVCVYIKSTDLIDANGVSIYDSNGKVRSGLITTNYGVSIWTNSSYQNRITGYYNESANYYNTSKQYNLSLNKATINKRVEPGYEGVVNGNSCYSLDGTIFAIYDNASLSHLVTTLTYSEAIKSRDFYPVFGTTYYVVETSAGKGYILDDEPYDFTITNKSQTSYSFTIDNRPGSDPLHIELQKVDETGQPKDANFYGTTFRLAYYAQDLGVSGTSNDPTVVYDIVLSAQNTTIVNGKVRLIITLDMLKSLTPVAGSNRDYFTNDIPSNWDEFPYGTFRLWETVAAPGFRVNNQVIRFRRNIDLTAAERAPIIENNASDGQGYWTGTSLTQEGEYELLLEEFESEGYYSLTKTLDDYYVSNGNNNYEYEVWNMSSGDSPIKIATGISQADGKVLWTYVAPDYYSNKKVDGQRVKLTGTKTYNLELPAEELAANGSRTRIQYQVRELCSSIAKKYGTTNIPYTYSAPKTGGVEWALSADKAYYYRNIQVSPNTNPANANHDDVVNNDEWINIGLTKALTDHDNFDRVYDMVNNLTFYLYNTDSNVLIATGSPVLVKDANGDVTSITVNWTRQHNTGYGITRGSATGEHTSTNYNLVNEATTLHYLPLGNYRIEERWTRAYLDTLDNSERIEIEATNNANGWTLDDTNANYVRYYQNVAATTDEHNYMFGAVNDVHDQWFNAAKSVTVAGDASTVKYELYYKEGNTYKKVATGTANVTGTVGTIYPVTWTYNGLHATKKIGGVDADTIALLEGDYRLVELIPETYYANGKTNVPYTYMCPAGFNVMWKNDEHTIADYFYRDFHATNSETSIISRQVTNTRIEGEITINKSAEVTNADYDFDFAIFYRGNGLEAENVGKFDGKDPLSLTKENVKDISSYLDTLTVHVIAGSGKATTIRVPEGWYEIVEIDAAGWAPKWYNNDTTTSQNHKIVHVDSNGLIDSEPIADDGVMLFGVDFEGAVIMNNVSVRLILHKLDAWTKTRLTEIVGDPNSPYIHLTFYLYEDGNANGVIDNDEMAIWTAGGDIDDDATVYFKNLGIGHYVVREVATVNGYYLTAADYAFVVDGPTDVEHDMENSPYCEPVLVHKLDNETHEPLEGAQFDVFVDVNNNGTYESDIDTPAQAWVDADEDLIVDDGEVVDCTFTYENGAYKSNGGLHFNDGDVFGSQYLLVELSAPANYFFVDVDGNFKTENTVVAFKVEKRSTTAADFQVTPKEFTLYNQTGSVFVNKVDEKTHEFLAGAEFTIYSDEACTNAVATFDDSSVVEINGVKYYHYKGLYLGDYYLVETDAPEYYETDNNVYPFSITLEGTPNGLGDGTHPVVDNKTWEVIPGVAGEFINHNPIIKTTLVDKDTQEHVVVVKDTITLVDTVEYSGLHVGETYIMHGELYDAETGTSLGITAEKQFVPETTSGTVDVEFEFAYEYVKEFTFVASEVCENVSRGKNVGIHFDINDTFQTVYGPEIHTTLTSDATEDHVAPQNETITLTDIVTYKNLVAGLEYKMVGTLVNKETGEVILDENGQPLVVEVPFTPEIEDGKVAVDGEVEVPFTFNSNIVKDVTVVAFEKLYFNDIEIVNHEDLDDDFQTVYIPEVHTSFYDIIYGEGENVARGTASEPITLVDIVYYDNLLPGKEYKISGKIMNKATNTPFIDADGNEYVAETTFTPDSPSGYEKVEFTVDADLIAGTPLVAFETLTYKDIELVVHADIEDEDQSVYPPKVHTTLLDVATEEHVASLVDGELMLIDYVDCTNLVVGKEYIVEGKLINVDTEEIITTNTVIFTADATEMTVEVEFTVDRQALIGTTTVAFEDLYYNDVKVATHADLTDLEQTVDFPEIHTTLLDTVTDDHVAPQNEETVLVDTVKYTNLTVGLEYTMHGTLMNAETGEPMLDDNGKEITAEYTWTPTEKDGFVELTFKFASKLLTGETMVAFEELTYKDITVATHNDLTDRDQTVDIPEIKTTFFDKDLAEVDDFENAKVGEKVTLIDTVHYENLTLLNKDGEKIEYTLHGTIMIKETNKPLTDEDGNPVEFTKTFVPTASTGDVDVEFTVDTTKLQGKTLVAFETLEYKGITLVIHADINDNDQTVHVPEIHTKATDKVDGDNVIDGRQHEQTIVDTVSYTNLIPGKTYVMTGKLVVKKDYKEGEALEYVTDANGKVVEVSTEFTPETANGTVDVEFTIDASKYAGKKLVAFETLTYEGIELTVHTDIEDKEQTITVSLLLHVKIAKADKDNIAYYLKDAEITIFYAELDENGEFKKDADGNVIYTVAKDAEGKDCVAVTDENGEVNFLIDYDENKVYYAQETKAPAGYNINPDKFEVTVTEDRETEGVCLITINILDAIIIIPPKTGDNMNIGLYIAISVIAVLGIAGGCFFLLKKKENESTEEKSEEKSEDKTEE